MPPLVSRPATPPGPPPAADFGHRGHAALREAFTPTQPQRNPRRLAGRTSELALIVQAVSYNRAHVVLYGDRGRGKTSLVNLVAAAARTAGYMVGRYACSHGSDFDEIIRGLVRDLPKPFLSLPAVDDPGLEGCEAALPQRPLHPRDVALLPGRLSGRRLVLIVDEFDRVADSDTRTRLADTIKQVSDRGARLSIVVVGVSDSLEELLGRHPSIQRNIIGVHLPLLSDYEVKEILAAGARHAGIEYPAHIQEGIAALARGVPYIAHLLGLHAGENALQRRAAVVTNADLRAAIARARLEIDPRVAVTFAELTRDGQDRQVQALLEAIAAAGHDLFGRFAVQEVDGAVRIGGRVIEPEPWARLGAAGVVRRCHHAGFGLYTFAEPMLLHYILLNVAASAEPAVLRATEPVA
ncbi:MAG: orc1/cdc6 family replication initiation protein [Rhodospirillales bacterium]|nr:orc1/cdc6 family replication initiation protein [Rhodospirillales bacterium]